MGLKTSQLNSERQEFDTPYLGETLHIVYNPQGFTPALERRINEAIRGETSAQAEALVFMLKSMLLDWDLENEDGSQFGVEDESLMQLPVKFLGDMIQAITDEIKAVTDAGKPSADTSQQTVQLATSPTGTS